MNDLLQNIVLRSGHDGSSRSGGVSTDRVATKDLFRLGGLANLERRAGRQDKALRAGLHFFKIQVAPNRSIDDKRMQIF